MIDQRELDILQMEAEAWVIEILKDFQEMMQGERIMEEVGNGEVYGQAG